MIRLPPNISRSRAQEVFIKVSRGLPAFKGGSSLSTWIYRIATNTVLDKLRNRPFRVIRGEDLSVDLEGLKDSEVASALGLRLQAAKMRLHRARERLKEELSRYCVFYRNDENEFICHLTTSTLAPPSPRAAWCPRRSCRHR